MKSILALLSEIKGLNLDCLVDRELPGLGEMLERQDLRGKTDLKASLVPAANKVSWASTGLQEPLDQREALVLQELEAHLESVAKMEPLGPKVQKVPQDRPGRMPTQVLQL